MCNTGLNPWRSVQSYAPHTVRPSTGNCESSWMSSWWRHQIETFSALLALCAGNSPVTGEFPSQRPVTRSFDIFFDLCLNKRLIKQSRRRWFKTPSRLLWCHCNAGYLATIVQGPISLTLFPSQFKFLDFFHNYFIPGCNIATILAHVMAEQLSIQV